MIMGNETKDRIEALRKELNEHNYRYGDGIFDIGRNSLRIHVYDSDLRKRYRRRCQNSENRPNPEYDIIFFLI